MDRRIARTRNAIMAAFASFAGTHELDSLTVSLVAERADINRVTFYAHFRDLDELIDAAAMGIVEEAGKAMAQPYVDSGAYRAVERNILAFIAKAEEGRPLFAWIGGSSRRSRLHDLVFHSIRALAEGRAKELKAAGLGTGAAALALDYVAAGCARLVMDYLMGASEPNARAKREFLALLPRLWLPSIYGALGIGSETAG